MDPHCRGCAYRQVLNGGSTNCGYAVITDHLRGCPPGRGCTHYTRRLPAAQSLKCRHNNAVRPLKRPQQRMTKNEPL